MSVDDSLVLIVLASARVWAVARAQLLWRVAVGPGWTLACVPLSIAVGGSWALAQTPVVRPAVGLVELAALVAFELALGTGLGLLVALPGVALLGGADESGARVGLSGASRSPWTGLTARFVLAGTLALGLHRPWFAAVHGVLAAWPVGNPVSWLPGMSALAVHRIAAWIHVTCFLALTFATPVLLVVAIIDLTSRVAETGGTVAEQLVAGVRPWLRASLSGLVLWASWSAYPHSFARVLTVDVP